MGMNWASFFCLHAHFSTQKPNPLNLLLWFTNQGGIAPFWGNFRVGMNECFVVFFDFYIKYRSFFECMR